MAGCAAWASVVIAVSFASVWAGVSVSLAMLAPKRSISPLTTISFFFSAPRLVLRLLCLTLPRFEPSPSSSSSRSGRASARLSRDAILFFGLRFLAPSFLLLPFRPALPGTALLLFLDVEEEDFVIREDEESRTRDRKEEDLMMRLSRLEERKESLDRVSGRWILAGRRGWIWPVMRWLRRVRAEGFACGTTGAWEYVLLAEVLVLDRRGRSACHCEGEGDESLVEILGVGGLCEDGLDFLMISYRANLEIFW